MKIIKGKRTITHEVFIEVPDEFDVGNEAHLLLVDDVASDHETDLGRTVEDWSFDEVPPGAAPTTCDATVSSGKLTEVE